MSVLERICAEKLAHVKRKKAETPIHGIYNLVNQSEPTHSFIDIITSYTQDQKPALIAEIKRASPSRGIIRPDFDPPGIARAYRAGGAACLSVLTDEPYFMGSDEYLRQVRAAVDLPILRKDFMLDPYQIAESRALGADCILLIMAALTDAQARELYDAAGHFGLGTLIEVHDAGELARAASLPLSPARAMIGVNSRNLKTLGVSLSITESLAQDIPPGFVKVAESGISCNSDIRHLQTLGYQAFLVGESLMRAADIEAATRRLLGSPEAV